jgi:hypothetical protein
MASLALRRVVDVCFKFSKENYASIFSVTGSGYMYVEVAVRKKYVLWKSWRNLASQTYRSGSVLVLYSHYSTDLIGQIPSSYLVNDKFISFQPL